MATAKHAIEIFSAGCSMCKETIEMVKKVAGSDHDVQVHDMQHGDTAARAKKLGVRSLPAVVVNGKLAGCCATPWPSRLGCGLQVVQIVFPHALRHNWLLNRHPGWALRRGRR